jgi:TnpA family transposase
MSFMNKPHFTQEQLLQVAKLSDSDIKIVNECRGEHNKLGFAYQLCYVKLFNRLPMQRPLELLDELATFITVQLDIPKEALHTYSSLRQATVSEHQESIRTYLHIKKYNQNSENVLKDYIFYQALQIQPTESLFIKATEFLRQQRILNPSDDTIERLIQTQREKARKYIFEKIYEEIAPPMMLALDDLLIVGTESYSKLYQIKKVPQKPSVAAMKALANKLVMIEQTGVLSIELDWLNNNYKRYFSGYVNRADANKLRELTPLHRYASLVCFLQEAYRDTIDHIFDMYQKAISTMYNQAEKTIDTYNKSKRATTRSCLTNHKKLCGELLAVAEGTADIEALFKKYPHTHLQAQIEEVEDLLTSKYSYNLNVVADRFSYMRQLAKPLLEIFNLELAPTGDDSLVKALQIVREILQDTRRSVPGNINLDFLPKAVRQAVKEDGEINRRRYEVAVFTALRDHIKCGNMAITGSKRFGKLEDFFISTGQWEAIRETFFKKNKLPQNPNDVPLYFENRLNNAFEYFLQREKNNIFAKVGKEGWELSKDPTDEFTPAKKQKLEALIAWLSERMRTIKLPDLLIEVDNDLHFTNAFLPAVKQNKRNSDDICNILTTIMAYGCNIGPHIMAQMITGISYQQIKHMFDWQFTDDAHRVALADVVNGIGSIEITKAWGDGKTAGADGQRFGYRRKTLQRTFSHKFNDFAIEFYIFVADNYAPFYNLVKEATDRDSSKVLDGYLYNISDLDPDEWYYDTHGYTEVNFAAFAMLGKTFSPRIKNIKTQWIYKINDTKDLGSLNKLVKGARHTIKMNPIVDQWDRMAQFYASFEAGHVTASTALKRLTGYTEKNLFYHANLQMGRILKTEHILLWMSDPFKRKRTRKGLLKVEQIHQLARDITYGNRGRLKGKSMEDINSSGNCTTLIMGAIIYWQAKEISRIIKEHNPEEAGIDIILLSHISPIAWSNVILYGEYKLNKDMVR